MCRVCSQTHSATGSRFTKVLAVAIVERGARLLDLVMPILLILIPRRWNRDVWGDRAALIYKCTITLVNRRRGNSANRSSSHVVLMPRMGGGETAGAEYKGCGQNCDFGDFVCHGVRPLWGKDSQLPCNSYSSILRNTGDAEGVDLQPEQFLTLNTGSRARSTINPIRCPDLPDAPDQHPNPFDHAFPSDGIGGDPSAMGLRFGIHRTRAGCIDREWEGTALALRRRPSTPSALRQRAQLSGLCGGRAPSLSKSSWLCSHSRRATREAGPRAARL